MKTRTYTITIMNTDKHERDVPFLLEKLNSIADTYSEAYEGMRVDVEEELDYQGLTIQQKMWMHEHTDPASPPVSDDNWTSVRIVCKNTLPFKLNQ